MELPIAITVSSFIFTVGSTLTGSVILYFKHLREKRDRQAEQVELENLKKKVEKLEENCARIGEIQNLKNDIKEVKDNLDTFHKEKREDVMRIYDRMEKLYEKVMQWLSEKK